MILYVKIMCKLKKKTQLKSKSFVEKKTNLIFVVETLKINLKRNKFCVLIITLSIKTFVTQTNNTTIVFLIDFDVKTNFILQIFVKQMQLFEFKKIVKQRVKIVDDRVIQIYEHYENVHIITRNNEKHVEKQNIDF